MMTLIKNWLHCEKGATAIEYGLMTAGISIAIIGTLVLLGPQLNAVFQAILGAFAAF